MMARPRKNAAASRASLLPESAPLPEIPVREQPYPLPEGWKWVRLSSLCSLQNGKAFKPSDWSESGIPIVRIQNLNNENCKFNFYNGHIDNKFLLKSGDLLFAWSGTPGTSFGAHIWMRGKAVLNQHIFRIDFDEEVILKYFFKYAINCRLEELIIQAHGGAGLQHVTKGVFEKTPIPLPPREEQERIVGHIESLFARLDEARQKAEAVRDSVALRRAAILHKAFTGELTQTPPREFLSITDFIAKEKYALKAGPFGSALKKDCYVPSGYKVYGQEQVISGDENIGDYYIDEEKYKELISNKIAPNDVLISLVGTVGKVLVLSPNCQSGIINPRLIKITFDKSKILPQFFSYYFQSDENINNYKKISHGTTMDVLNMGILKQLKIPCFSLPEQREIVRILDDLLGREQRIREAADAVVAHIERMKKAILARAFRGELGRADCPSRP